MGVGAMLGGGIFAVLGIAVEQARGGTPVAFGLAGLIALTTAYSYARLAVTEPSQGATLAFLHWAFGPGILTGSLKLLLWLSYVIVVSFCAYTFGSYGASFLPRVLQPLWKHVLITIVVIGVTCLKMLGIGSVTKTKTWIVAAEISILLLFIGLGIWELSPSKIAPSAWNSPLQLVVAGMIIFLAYEGFELIAKVSPDLRDPETDLPRALFTAVVFVILLYVLVAAVALGNLSMDAVTLSKDFALAEAAVPFLGSFGFSLIAVAALFSTLLAINVTLTEAAQLSYAIATDGEISKQPDKEVWHSSLEALLIPSGLALLVANTFDLYSISITGSLGFLIIFAAVNVANSRLHHLTKSVLWISALGAITCISAFLALIWHTVHYSPERLILPALMLFLAILTQILYRWWIMRTISSSSDSPRRRGSEKAPADDLDETSSKSTLLLSQLGRKRQSLRAARLHSEEFDHEY